MLDRNLERTSRKALDAGVNLRPYCKTAKSAEVGRRATANHSGVITVATLNEAAYFIRQGFTDLTYAVGIVPAKLERAAVLQRETGARISVLLDSVAMARHVAGRAVAFDTPVSVFVELDAEPHRTGVAADSDELLVIGQIRHDADNVDFK